MAEGCKEIEKLDKKHGMFNLQRKVNKVAGDWKKKGSEVMKDNGRNRIL